MPLMRTSARRPHREDRGGTRANENAVTNGERAAAHAAQNGRIHDHAIGADVDGTALGANHGSEADRDVGTDQHLAADRCVRRDAGRPVDNRPFSLVLKTWASPGRERRLNGFNVCQTETRLSHVRLVGPLELRSRAVIPAARFPRGPWHVFRRPRACGAISGSGEANCQRTTARLSASERYRARAEECRHQALTFRDKTAQTQMFQLAADYERKAVQAEAFEPKPAKTA